MTTPQYQALLARSEAMFGARRPAEAERYARQALALSDEEPAYGYLCLALEQQGRVDEALRVISDGLARNPEGEWLHRVRAALLLRAGRPTEALAGVEAALRIDPSGAHGHFVRSQALLALDRIAEARAAAAEAVTLGPDEHAFHAQLGHTWMKESPSKAEQHFRAALALDPEQSATLDALGEAMLAQGRADEAAETIHSAVQLDPTDDWLKRSLLRATWPRKTAALCALLLGAWFVGTKVVLSWSHRAPGRSGVAFALGAGGFVLAFALAWHLVTREERRQREANPRLADTMARVNQDDAAGRIPHRPVGRRTGLVTLVVGALLLLATVPYGYRAWARYAVTPSAPRSSTLDDARPDEWVQILDASLRCETLRHLESGDYVAARTGSGQDFVVRLPRKARCEPQGGMPRGTVLPMNPRLASSLEGAGFERPPGAVVWLVPSGAPGDHLFAAILLTALAALGGGLAYLGFRWWRPRLGVRAG